MEDTSIPVIRPFVSVLDWYRSVAARLDTTLLKRVGVVTYFGVYAAIALGGRTVLNEATGTLPPVVRPPELAPLHVTLGLPRSFAWALVSFTTMLVVLGVLVAVSLYRRDPDDQDPPARLGGTSLAGTLSPTARARSVGRRVRTIGRRIRGTEPDSSPSVAGDRPSPSTDGGATVGLDTSDAAGSAVEGDDGPTDGPVDGDTGSGAGAESVGTESTEREPAVDPLNPFGGDVPEETVDAFDDAEVLDDDEDATDADDEPAAESEPVADDAADGVAETPDPPDAPDESVPWPDEDAADAEETGTDGAEEASADAEWPGDWVSGDEL